MGGDSVVRYAMRRQFYCGSFYAVMRSAEHDGAAAVEENAVLGMPAHGARQRHAFDVAADRG